MLLTISELSIAFGDKPLLDNASLTIEAGQRIGLLGRNGEGKSTLLKAINGDIQADSGEIRFAHQDSIAMLTQKPVLIEGESVFEAVVRGLGDIGEVLNEYYDLVSNTDMDDTLKLKRMSDLQSTLDHNDGWNIEAKVEKTLTRLELDGKVQVSTLSGGWQRRVNLAQALVSSPDILLLDEPTNHLDIETIEWLENQLRNFKGGIIIVTHDRQFLQQTCTDIVDLERGILTLWNGNYQDYLRRKQEFLEQEARQNALFDKKLSQEEVWIRQGIKARRTRNEGRVRALEVMREERKERRTRQGKAKFNLDVNQKSGKLVIEANNISVGYQQKVIAQDFSCIIMRGDRIGILGPNGIGKTTLIKTLLNEIPALAGTIKHGTTLKSAYFTQSRSDLDDNQTIVDAIGQGREFIEIGGKDTHIISYLSNFLFSPATSRAKISSLSGGERARVLLAKLFSQSFNLLIMDEPTNDLDIETLELLEERLLEFTGTLILVSHDRDFIDNVVTSTFAINEDGSIDEQIGGYSDWLRQRRLHQPIKNTQKKADSKSSQKTPPTIAAHKPTNKKKLSYHEQRELDALPEKIEALESELLTLTNVTMEANFYQQPKDEITQVMEKIEAVNQQLTSSYKSWESLDND